MRKKRPVESRESQLASGWTVEAEVADESAAGASAGAVSNSGAGADVSGVTLADPEATGSETAGDAEADTVNDAPAKPQFSNLALVLLGLFGGLYLLYAWVWLSWAQYYAPANASLAASAGALGGTSQNIVFWLAPLAPILWFLAVLLLGRGKKLRSLVLWIVIGAIVLLPLPVFDGWGL